MRWVAWKTCRELTAPLERVSSSRTTISVQMASWRCLTQCRRVPGSEPFWNVKRNCLKKAALEVFRNSGWPFCTAHDAEVTCVLRACAICQKSKNVKLCVLWVLGDVVAYAGGQNHWKGWAVFYLKPASATCTDPRLSGRKTCKIAGSCRRDYSSCFSFQVQRLFLPSIGVHATGLAICQSPELNDNDLSLL